MNSPPMLHTKNKCLALVLASVAAFLILCFSPSAQAQNCGLLPDPVAYLSARIPLFSAAVDKDQPGIANPAAPMVGPFCFSAEASIRPMWLTLTSAQYRDPILGLSLDLARDLGFVERGWILAAMGRFQFGRFSGRIQYEANLNAIKGANGYLDWPDMQYGADIDLIQNKGLRAGIDFDMYRFGPNFSFGLPDGRSGLVRADIPVTMGVHAAYNPYGYTGLSSSVEARVRWPIGAGARITEAEIAAGIKAPTTIIGTSAVRGGWRYLELSFGDTHGREVDVKTSSVFVEFVFSF